MIDLRSGRDAMINSYSYTPGSYGSSSCSGMRHRQQAAVRYGARCKADYFCPDLLMTGFQFIFQVTGHNANAAQVGARLVIEGS